MSEETEDLIFDYDGDASREAIWQAVDERAPELLLPGGRLQHIGRDCVLQTVDGGAMTATFTIVTRTKEANRHGNQVQIVESDLGRGLLTDFYQTNPIVLYDHGFGGVMLPIGLSADPSSGKLSLTKSKSKVTATVWFSKLPHAEPIYAAVDERILRMASIGYGVSKAMRLKPPKQTVLPEGVENWDRYVGFDFVETEMFEWSITPVGADRGSLRQCIERQRIHDVKLPPWLIQSFEPHAEPKTVQGRGADFTRRTIEQSGLVLEGPPDVVDEAVRKLVPTLDEPPAASSQPEKGGEQKQSAYGYCPTCGEPGVSAERRMDGHAYCQSGHKWKHGTGLKSKDEFHAQSNKPTTTLEQVEQWLRQHMTEGFEEAWQHVQSKVAVSPAGGAGGSQQQSAPPADEPLLDLSAIAEVYRMMVTPQEPTISVESVLQAIGTQVAQEIASAMKPAIEETKSLRAELQRMTGRLPS